MLSIPIMTEQEFAEALEERKKEQLPQRERYGMDGYISVGSVDVLYRGIPYYVAVLRYYSLNDVDKWIREPKYHAVVEHPKINDRIMEIVKHFDGYTEFLYHDTLHAGQEHYTLEQHIQTSQDEAESDIDWLLDKAIHQFQSKIAADQDMVNELKQLVGDSDA